MQFPPNQQVSRPKIYNKHSFNMQIDSHWAYYLKDETLLGIQLNICLCNRRIHNCNISISIVKFAWVDEFIITMMTLVALAAIGCRLILYTPIPNQQMRIETNPITTNFSRRRETLSLFD